MRARALSGPPLAAPPPATRHLHRQRPTPLGGGIPSGRDNVGFGCEFGMIPNALAVSASIGKPTPKMEMKGVGSTVPQGHAKPKAMRGKTAQTKAIKAKAKAKSTARGDKKKKTEATRAAKMKDMKASTKKVKAVSKAKLRAANADRKTKAAMAKKTAKDAKIAAAAAKQRNRATTKPSSEPALSMCVFDDSGHLGLTYREAVSVALMTLEACVGPEQFIQKLQDFIAFLRTNGPIYFVDEFAGGGTAHIAWEAFVNAVRCRYGLEIPMQGVAAADHNETCNGCLVKDPSVKHVFNDILNIFPDSIRKQVEGLVSMRVRLTLDEAASAIGIAKTAASESPSNASDPDSDDDSSDSTSNSNSSTSGSSSSRSKSAEDGKEDKELLEPSSPIVAEVPKVNVKCEVPLKDIQDDLAKLVNKGNHAMKVDMGGIKQGYILGNGIDEPDSDIDAIAAMIANGTSSIWCCCQRRPNFGELSQLLFELPPARPTQTPRWSRRNSLMRASLSLASRSRPSGRTIATSAVRIASVSDRFRVAHAS